VFSIYTALVVVVALALCPFWRRERHFAPLYLWAVYCGLGPAQVFGVSPLRFRWGLGCAFGAMGLLWLWRARRRTVDSMVVLPGLLIAWALASAVYSELPDYSLLRAIALVPMYFGAFLGVRCLLQEQGGVERVVGCLIVMIGVQVALAAGAYLFAPGASFGGRFQGVHRATGTAHQVAYALPFTLLFASLSGRWQRAAWLLLTLGLLYLLVITRSRTGLIGGALVTPIAYLAFFRRARGVHLVRAVLGVIALAAALWAMFASENTMEYLRISSAEELVRTRAGRWELILQELWDSPWIGHGYGTVRYFAVGGAMTRTLEAGSAAQVNTHNEYLSLLYDLGVVPCLMLAAFVLAIGARGAGRLARPAAPAGTLDAALIACFLSWFVDALDTITHDGLLTIGNPAATWFWIKSLALYYGGAARVPAIAAAAVPRRRADLLPRGGHVPA